AVRCPRPVDGELNPVELAVAIVGRRRPSLVDLRLLVDDGEEVGDLLSVLEVDLFHVLLESRKRRTSADFLAESRTQPLVEEQRASLRRVATDADLLFPELRLKRPVIEMCAR